MAQSPAPATGPEELLKALSGEGSIGRCSRRNIDEVVLQICNALA
jgi:hypothetical protein